MTPDELAAAREYYETRSVVDEIENSFRIDPRDPEYREYAEFWNAITWALIGYAADSELERPCFSQRKDIADRAWRNLHPDSKYGA